MTENKTEENQGTFQTLEENENPKKFLKQNNQEEEGK